MSIGLSTRGRMGRRPYFIWSLMVTIATYACAVALAFAAGVSESAINTASMIGVGVAIVGTVAQMCLAARRLHDIGRPGWHCWFFLIPFYNIYLSLVLLLAPGVEDTQTV